MSAIFIPPMGMTAGSAIFGSLLPASQKKGFIGMVYEATQDSVEQLGSALHPSMMIHSASAMIIPQFIGVF